MNKFTKVVNIYPSMPITGVNPPIRSTVRRVTKSIEEIRTCLMARAIVEEILPNGEIIRLNIGNYDKCLNCTCKTGCGCSTTVTLTTDDNKSEEKTPWQIAYDNALAGKNLAIMSRKQRRSAEAAARAVADAAVAEKESTEEVVIGVADIVTVEENIETTVETKTEVEEVTEEVKTDDVEKVTVAE